MLIVLPFTNPSPLPTTHTHMNGHLDLDHSFSKHLFGANYRPETVLTWEYRGESDQVIACPLGDSSILGEVDKTMKIHCGS